MVPSKDRGTVSDRRTDLRVSGVLEFHCVTTVTHCLLPRFHPKLLDPVPSRLDPVSDALGLSRPSLMLHQRCKYVGSTSRVTWDRKVPVLTDGLIVPSPRRKEWDDTTVTKDTEKREPGT